VTALLAAVEAMRRAYGALRPDGDGVSLPVPLAGFQSLTDLMGYGEIAQFEARYKEV
jgi:hypothetical protein